MVKLEEPFTLNDFKCFEIKAIEPKNTMAKTVKKEVPKGPVITSYLDGKKTLYLAIALGRIKLSDAELYNQIIERKFENETLIRQLLLYLATPEEFEQWAAAAAIADAERAAKKEAIAAAKKKGVKRW